MGSSNIWVIFELSEGKPSRVSLEIMTRAAALAAEAGAAAEAVVIGEDAGAAAEPEHAVRPTAIVRPKRVAISFFIIVFSFLNSESFRNLLIKVLYFIFHVTSNIVFRNRYFFHCQIFPVCAKTGYALRPFLRKNGKGK